LHTLFIVNEAIFENIVLPDLPMVFAPVTYLNGIYAFTFTLRQGNSPPSTLAYIRVQPIAAARGTRQTDGQTPALGPSFHIFSSLWRSGHNKINAIKVKYTTTKCLISILHVLILYVYAPFKYCGRPSPPCPGVLVQGFEETTKMSRYWVLTMRQWLHGVMARG